MRPIEVLNTSRIPRFDSERSYTGPLRPREGQNDH